MIDLTQIDATYRLFASSLEEWLPEGVVEIDLAELHDLGLTKITENENRQLAPITRQFHVIESSDKITLFNQQFLIWMVPCNNQVEPSTVVFIALNGEPTPRLELVFETRGVYNTSKMVLDVLERYLLEIQENERVLEKLATS